MQSPHQNRVTLCRTERYNYRFGRSKKSSASSRAVIEHLTKAWKGLGRCPRHFIFRMRYPHSSETCCTYANSRRTTCLHGLSVRLTPNPLCWLGILFRSQSKWAFNGFSAIESAFASKQVFDGRSYRRARPIAWERLGWLSHPKRSVSQSLE